MPDVAVIAAYSLSRISRSVGVAGGSHRGSAGRSRGHLSAHRGGVVTLVAGIRGRGRWTMRSSHAFNPLGAPRRRLERSTEDERFLRDFAVAKFEDPHDVPGTRLACVDGGG